MAVIILGFGIIGFVNGAFAVLPLFTMKYKLSPEHYEQYSSSFAVCLGIGVLAGSVAGNYLVPRWGYVRNIVARLFLMFAFGLLLAYRPGNPALPCLAPAPSAGSDGKVRHYLHYTLPPASVVVTPVIICPMTESAPGWRIVSSPGPPPRRLYEELHV